MKMSQGFIEAWDKLFPELPAVTPLGVVNEAMKRGNCTLGFYHGAGKQRFWFDSNGNLQIELQSPFGDSFSTFITAPDVAELSDFLNTHAKAE